MWRKRWCCIANGDVVIGNLLCGVLKHTGPDCACDGRGGAVSQMGEGSLYSGSDTAAHFFFPCCFVLLCHRHRLTASWVSWLLSSLWWLTRLCPRFYSMIRGSLMFYFNSICLRYRSHLGRNQMFVYFPLFERKDVSILRWKLDHAWRGSGGHAWVKEQVWCNGEAWT